jgi:hypothetical protein
MGNRLRWLSFLLLLVGCGAPAGVDDPQAGRVDPAQVLAELQPPAGWTPAGEVAVYDRETLYDLVDGQADAFFAYGFEAAAVRTYEKSGGETLRVEIWQAATPADAYGLFTTYRGGTSVDVGNEACADPGRRLGFWQERYNVRLFALEPIADPELMAVATALSAVLPQGGDVPALIGRLPEANRIAGSKIFFRQEISIQDTVWLGGENRLGLGPETGGGLARYELEAGIATLLLIEYPDPAAAVAAGEALQAAPVEGLVLAQTHDEVLAVVFGAASLGEAEALLAESLGTP